MLYYELLEEGENVEGDIYYVTLMSIELELDSYYIKAFLQQQSIGLRGCVELYLNTAS